MFEPYVSLVVYSRNDDHGGNLENRSRASFRTFIEQVEELEVPSEIVVVDYNPPRGVPKLAEQLRFPERSRFCTVRFIEVPESLHATTPQPGTMPLHNMVARNVGLRRARGRFRISSGVDILYSRELIELFARRALAPDRLYLINRSDVPRDMAQVALDTRNLNDVFGACRRRVMTKLNLTPGDFQMLSAEKWFELKGYPEMDPLGRYVDLILCRVCELSGVANEVLEDPVRIFHIDHDSGWKRPLVRLSELFPWKDGWIRTVVFKVGYYLDKLDFRKMPAAKAGVKALDKPDYQRIAAELASGARPLIHNGDDWGLAGHELPETVAMCAAGDPLAVNARSRA